MADFASKKGGQYPRRPSERLRAAGHRGDDHRRQHLILISISNIAFYWREQRAEFNYFLNLAVPVVGTLIFIPALLAAFGIDFGGLGISALTSPANAAPWIILAWMLIGVGLLLYLRQRAPERIDQTGRVFLEA